MAQATYILIGLVMGAFSGFLGIGGGLILVPILVYFFGLTQHQAQGTSLVVMIPPVTLLAALQYLRGGNVKLGMAMFIAIGFAIGGFVAAGAAQGVPGAVLRKIFGVVMLLASLKIIFSA